MLSVMRARDVSGRVGVLQVTLDLTTHPPQ